ncbi:hypothetical protein FCG67_07400 [Rhodococcus oryzae]|uniref:Uncharacterized protein n=2 Tax=Nocardiaceae TaxID=85025 RepID=A0ABY2RQF1_9NOCA|nr:hypothetical protein FCG67_07400 [Rhodococcus oryzae]
MTTNGDAAGREEPAMSLNIFAGWVGFGCVLLTALTLGMFLVAAGSGHPGWAIVAGSALVVVITTAVAVVGGTIHHDHKLGRDTPHFP